MSQQTIRSRFSSICDALPEGARRELLEDHLITLLDHVSVEDQTRLIGLAQSAQSRFAGMPKLDLPKKKAEVDMLLDELKRDGSRGAINSHRDEIYEHIVDSLVTWLSDVWQVAFEYGVDFKLVHECLLFCSNTVMQVHTAGVSCKCGFVNLYVPFTIKDRQGHPVKHFSYSGAHYLEDAFLWIWRDALLKILSEGKARDLALIPEILKDIQAVHKDWAPLDRLLFAGGKIVSDDDGDDTDYEEEESDGDEIQCPNHAAHWSNTVLLQLPALRSKIADSLFDTFKLTPSPSLYNAILQLAPTLHLQLLVHLHATMSYSAPAAATALTVHTVSSQADAALATLTAAQSVLRVRDAPAMQGAVHMIARLPEHNPAALAIVLRELYDCVAVMRGHIAGAGAFGGIENSSSRAQLVEVLQLRHNTHQRQQRVESWVDGVATAAPSAANPLTFAAFLMGFPPGFEPDDTEEPDPFLFAGIKENDPEYESLREEWRPRLKERFEGWVKAAENIRPGGQELLNDVARVVGEGMPFMRGADIVDEMITRIHDKPTKFHVCDALEALSSFMKAQRRKAVAEKNRAEKRKKTGTGTGNSKRSRRPNGAGSSSTADYTTMPGLEALD